MGALELTTREKWKRIQRSLGLLDDGDPGKLTATAVADALGVSLAVAEATVIDPGDVPVVSDAALDLIRHFESCLEPTGDGYFKAYPDPASGWQTPTIGWGTTHFPDGRKVQPIDVISQKQADFYFAWETRQKAAGIAHLVTIPLNADQFGALVSLAYNVGLGNFKRSTLLRMLNEGNERGAADEFLKWNKARNEKGELVVMAGLTRRRKSERNLFLGIHPAIVHHS